MPTITRRGALAAGAAGVASAAAAVVVADGRASTTPTATTGTGTGAEVRATTAVPVRETLRRSDFLGAIGTDFTARSGSRARTLRLDAVDDVVGAAAGAEHAFNLVFSTAAAHTDVAGIRRFSNPVAPTRTLFVAPVGAPTADGRQHYQALVNGIA